jgi:hypothetical protein
MNTYLFFRKDGWYPLELEDDQHAKFNAELNPGTIRVETPTGRVIWADNNRLN